MTRLRFTLCLLAAVVPATAQSQLTTTFVSDNSGSMGGGVYFNLTAHRGITIGGLDCNLYDSPGTPGTVELWILNGTSHVGRETSSNGWTLAATGPITAAGLDRPSHVTFTAPFFMAAGNYGAAVCHLGVGAAYTNGNGNNQVYSNPELTLTAGSANNACLAAGTVYTPRVFNGAIHYGLGNQIAQVQRSGTGCVGGEVSFYEFFTNPGSFDLANRSFELIPTGTGYRVQTSTSTYLAPTGTGLALGDDALSPALTLPFTLSFPGGSTTQVRACSNGFLYLNGFGSDADYTPSVSEALSGGPRLFAFWTDLLPDSGTNINNVFFQADAPNQRALVTWRNVPEYGASGTSNTFQLVLNANGRIEFIYRAATNTQSSVLVGFSPGANNRDPGNRDLTAAMPFTTQRDGAALQLNATRPILGANVTLTATNVPAGSLGGIMMIGPAVPGIDLTSAGMPGCFLYVNPMLVSLPFATAGSSANVILALPNAPELVGTQVPVQAATISPGATPLGAITSNLATLVLGLL
jgi:hypothetical protein